MSWELADRIEETQPSDPLRDYCQWSYPPIAAPAVGALRSSAPLYHSFKFAGVSERMLAFCDRLVERVGKFNTVWGVKFAAGKISWEFYFYDYHRMDRRFGIRDFLAAAQGLLTVNVPVADAHPYFMFSVEIGAAHIDDRAQIDQIDLYIGNPGSAVSSGICYGLSQRGMELRNFYFFFNVAAHGKDIREKIASNAHVPWAKLRLDDILWPDMNAETIVVANKRHNDGLYFSRIRVGDLIRFLERLKFPQPLIDYFGDNRERLAHHYWDVGYDYLPGSTGIRLLKGSYYGLL